MTLRLFASCRILARVALVTALSGCSPSPNPTPTQTALPAATATPAPSPAKMATPLEAAYEEALSAPDAALTAAFEKLKALLPKVEGDFITEGDLLRTEGELRNDIAAARRDRQRRTTGEKPLVVLGPELVAALKPNGDRDFWAAGHRTLIYSIDRNSFSDMKQASIVETHIKQATEAWESACTVQQKCDITFEFREDPKPSHQHATFIVRNVNSQGAFIAASFFPSYPSDRRVLNIDPTFFTTSYDKTGVLRHELGHVLGYRHEHIRDILGCRLEGTQWLPITPYDPHSVMHYLCGGGGTLSLALTDLDKQGHVLAYGGK